MSSRHCGMCGFPIRGAPRCGACGSMAGSGPRVPPPPVPRVGPRPDEYPELHAAFLAWDNRQYPALVGQCLAAVGVSEAQPMELPTGPGWAFAYGRATLFVVVDRASDEIAIEAPMVRLQPMQETAMLRTLLEANSRMMVDARLCLRDAIVLLRFADHVENVSPPRLVRTLADVCHLASELGMVLPDAFGADFLGSKARFARDGNFHDWSLRGTPRLAKLPDLHAPDPPPLPPVPRTAR